MPVHSSEYFLAPTDSRSSLFGRGKNPDRRRRARSQVHWQVHFSGIHPIGSEFTTTENLSSEGFCCLAPVSFTPGEIRPCLLRLPSPESNHSNRVFSLDCTARVIWVKPAEESGNYLIGWEIVDYRFRGGSNGTVAYIDRLVSQ